MIGKIVDTGLGNNAYRIATNLTDDKKDIEIISIKYAPKQEINIKFRDTSYVLKFLEIQNHFLVYFCK